ncbi:carboxylesterase family protein [Isoptericola halotolerans]|uniref:Carboxylic ester hydrolase n=1 Tax=Isoptericola halotolerans TaxID=300560 RepID=A0ABX2A0Z3_9MICO|nr:carboxylesterase family protein [Isoptericola halotolerans]NOV95555.1 para-nitrobenzyl esterase [Isoptericola halotolerans]
MQGNRPEVRTRAGRARGTWSEASAASPSAAVFLGIPYAEPPTGDRRFAAPVPHARWDGVRDTGTFGPTPQRGDAGITLIPEPSVPGDATLNVNVFTPAPVSTARLPVLVYVHGGGYTSGSPASPWYDGAAFARDGVVTVTLSYRLGFDGFGWVDGAPSNRGVRDWLLALEWVQENITAFGGDPDRVTIAGQSAGGGAVLTLLGMPAAHHLFRAVWCLSGALGDVPEIRARQVARRLASAAGVDATVDGFRRVPEGRLLALQQDATRPPGRGRLTAAVDQLTHGATLGPVVDGELLLRPTVASLRAGAGADKPLVLGTADDEFSMVLDGAARALRWVPPTLALAALRVPRSRRRAYLAANAGLRAQGTARLLGRYVTDMVFRRTVVEVASARDAAQGPARTWAYRFTWPSPTHGIALHCLDVPFFFDVLDAPGVRRLAGDDPPQRLADDVHGAASRFVTTLDPGWTAWTDDPGATRAWDAGGPTDLDDGYASVEPLVRAPRRSG